MNEVKKMVRHIVFLLFAVGTLASCSKPPQMKIENPVIDMGTLMPGETVEDSVIVKNTGGGDLHPIARSGCECIELEGKLPEKIAPGDSAVLPFVYYAPDSAMTDTSTIYISASDKGIKPQKTIVVAKIMAPKLSRRDSTITLIPFAAKNPLAKRLGNQVVETFFKTAKQTLGFAPVSPNKIIADITGDKQYGKRPIYEIMRKWALMDSVRWVIGCEFTVDKDSNLVALCTLVDGLAEFPMEFKVLAPQAGAGRVFMDSLKSFFAHIGEHYRQAIIQGMQRKWTLQRQKILGKPLPDIKFVNVLTGDTLTLADAGKNVVLMHFFSIDCEHCEEEIEWLNKLAKSHPKGLVVWGVSVDMSIPDSVKAFAQKRQLPYPILLPTEKSHRRLTRVYGGATPQTIIVDQNGIVREFFVGFNKALIARLEGVIKNLVGQPSGQK